MARLWEHVDRVHGIEGVYRFAQGCQVPRHGVRLARHHCNTRRPQLNCGRDCLGCASAPGGVKDQNVHRFFENAQRVFGFVFDELDVVEARRVQAGVRHGRR